LSIHDIYKTKSLRADQQEAGKQGRDDSIKQFGIQPYPVHIFNVERYVLYLSDSILEYDYEP